MTNTVNWAETSDDDYLPSSSVQGPDEKGIKKIIDYRREDDGQRVKVTRKIKVITRQRKIPRSIAERREWTKNAKFGACKGVKSGDELEVTYFASRDEIIVETPEDEAKKDAGLDIMATIRAGLLKKATDQRLRASGLLEGGEGAGALKTGTALSRESAPSSMEIGGGEGKYRPPARQAGGGQWGGGSQDRDETNTLRVTNISEDTTEDDLKELFRQFGQLTRTYLAKDRETGASRGFAYISFVRKEEAERAMEKLDGYGYDYLILSVEWAKPSGRDDAGGQSVMKYATGYGGALPQGKGD
jgi:translation initiation factor 3 subunit G